MFNPVNYTQYLLTVDTLVILEADENFCNITGYTQEDVMSGRLSQRTLLSEEYWDEYVETVTKYVGASGRGYLEHPIRKKDGSLIYVFCFGDTFFSEKYNMNVIQILVSDISSKEAVQKEVDVIRKDFFKQAAVLENVLLKTKTAIINVLYDQNGAPRYIYCTKGTDRLFGRGASENFLRGEKRLYDYMNEEDKDKLRNLFEESVSRKSIVKDEIRFEIEGEERWFEVSCTYSDDRDDGNMWSVFLNDNTEEKKKDLDMMVQNRFLNLLSENSKDILVEYRRKTDRFIAFRLLNGEKSVIIDNENFAKNIMDDPHIHPNDRAALVKKVREKNSESINLEVRYSFDETDKKFRWYRLNLFVTENPYDKSEILVGRCSDISREVSERQQLLKRLRYDALTGLYNSGTAKELISDYINNFEENKGKVNALLIIDIDNFKNVNDSFGHLCGDDVLEEVGDDIGVVFGAGKNIAGRIGGDEFIVLMTNAESIRSVEEEADRICSILNKKIMNDGKCIEISTSVGISFFGECKTNYEEVFACADKALYLRKAKGKNGYDVYDTKFDYDSVAYKSERGAKGDF